MPLILTEIRDNIGIITFNNPEKRNALSVPLINELVSALDSLKRKKIPVVILRAAPGAKTWSAGFDVNELAKTHKDPFSYDSPLEKMLRVTQHYPGPVIAMVQGGVWGGACDLAVTCDMIIGDPSCSFAITPVKLGIPYNASGISHFLNRLGANIAKEMFFTATPICAERAKAVGLLNHLVPAGELEPFTFNLAKGIAGYSSLSIAVIKEQFRLLTTAYPITPEAFERIGELRRRVYESHDYREGIIAFLEKRPPVFKGE